MKNILLLTLIVVLTVVGAFFIYPNGEWANKILPWRLGLDLVGGSYLIYEVNMADVATTDRDSVMNGLRDVIERRVNLFGVSEPRITTSKTGEIFRLNVELAGIKNVKEAIQQIGETPFLQFAEIKFGKEDEEPRYIFTELTGRYIKGAQLGFSQVNLPLVNLEFNSEGAVMFENITERNVGEFLAIFLDGEIIEIARVTEVISGGRAQISGMEDIKEARKLVERLNAGALPAPIKLVNQQTISATLGQDSLQKTISAGLWGTLAVLIFMVLYYRKLGIFAVLALLIYIILTLSVFKLFMITMTLAGIAGLILSIGMAVDANILIFERTKEELKQGASWASAVHKGFKRAWTSIRDSNLTTILTTVILFYFTTSFIKGFALALLIGVLVSMFTAITVTKNLLKIFSKT